jgi:DNA polymerase III delta prime subunit
MLGNLDRKIDQSESNVLYKMTENNKMITTEFQIEYQKILEEITRNTDSLSSQLKKSVKSQIEGLDQKFADSQRSENKRLADLIIHNKRRVQDEVNEKIKDLEAKLNNH